MAVRKTFSKFKAIGRLKENKLELISDKFDDGTPKNTIRGRFVLAVGEGEYQFDVFTSDKFNSDDEINSNYSSLVELKSCGLDTPVEVVFKTDRYNDYPNKRGTLTSIDVLNVITAKILNEPSDDEKIEGEIEGMITKIIPEFYKEEETGRLKVEVTGVGQKEKAVPHQLIVEEENSQLFGDGADYKLGTLSTFDVKIVTTRYGNVQTERVGGFGRKADISSGFTRQEWIIFGAESPVEEEQVNRDGKPLYIDPKEIKNLLEERKIELEQILKESKNKTPKAKGGKQSFKAMSKASTADNNPFDIGENPFL